MVGASSQKTARATTALIAASTEVGADLSYEAVHNVIDGEIIVLNTGEKVRLTGINTPELRRHGQLSEAFSEEASSPLFDLITGQLA